MRAQPVIIGAGPAGCAAAVTLAAGGHPPILIDRSREATDKVCGDFLGTDTIAHARRLGVDPAAFGAVPISRVRLVHKTREREAPLPFPALSLSRRIFDQSLRAAAERAGATLWAGITARGLARNGDGWTVELRAQPGERIATPHSAGALFLATGKHDLRDHPRPRNAHPAVGLKQYFHLTDRARRMLGDTTELTLFPGGYAGMQPVEADRTGLCIAIRQADFQALGATWDRLLALIGSASPRFAALIAGSRAVMQKPLAVAGVPYGFLHRGSGDRLFRLGDQAAVIPSLTGDGMAIALHSGRIAAEACLAGRDADDYHARLRDVLASQMRLSGVLHAAFLSPRLQPWVLRAASLPSLVSRAAHLTRITPC